MTRISPSANSLRWKRYRESDDRKYHAGGGSITGGPDDPANANSLDNLRRDIEALKTQMAKDKAELENLKAEMDVRKAKRGKKAGKAKKEKEKLEAEIESISSRDLDGGVVANIDPVLCRNVIQPLEIPEPDESSDEGYLPESEYNVLPQTASTMSTMSMMSILSARSSMSAVHGMPVIPPQPESQAQPEPSFTHTHPNNSESHSKEETHPHPQSHSHSRSSQRGIKFPPSSRPGSRTSRRSEYSDFAGYSSLKSVVIPFQIVSRTERFLSWGNGYVTIKPIASCSLRISLGTNTRNVNSETERTRSIFGSTLHLDQLAPGITTTNFVTNKLQTSFTTQLHSTLASTPD
ncbi:hypothetical protein EV368DRAFT_65211 [Lentinula lateritia]|uniref:Uncharacterized protein n=1 Tax=Lentinula aff. lateritia TaxID=2804960 RepID=A0ACC1TT18_9AGAR|nr:hypothetical protein F5876DRAFT_67959 [Lentinula aff. lateritia]KAJ3852072.1 hypothetical protein EV368DRAFT_65211 [Lentinula lateritia]